MKVAYLLNWELSSNDGVSKKVYAQTHEWQALGNEVKVFCIARTPFTTFGSVPVSVIPKKTSSNILQEFLKVYQAYNSAYLLLKAFQPDIIYFRFDIYQPALKKILTAFPSVIEMNSNDMEELRLLARKNLKGKIRHYYHQLVRDGYLGAVDGFCCVTNEIAALPSVTKFNKPVFVVPNAIQLREFRNPSFTVKASKSLPNLAFIGTPDQSWHGIDKILQLARACEGKLQFHIIGIEPTQEAPANVIFYGYLQKQEYESILLSADIGVCTLALHRKNMEEASPLKTREYLAYGLPIIMGYQDTAFMDEDVPEWVLQLPNTESNITENVDKILNFCLRFTGVKLAKNQTQKYIDSFVLEQQRLLHMGRIANKVVVHVS